MGLERLPGAAVVTKTTESTGSNAVWTQSITTLATGVCNAQDVVQGVDRGTEEKPGAASRWGSTWNHHERG